MQKHRAFTLVEMMVVVGIIVTLAAITVPNFSQAIKKGRDAQRKSDVAAIQQALVMYRSDNGKYPIGPFPSTYASALNSNYMKDPPTKGPTSKSYSYSSDGKSFTICSDSLEIAGAGNSSDNKYCLTHP
ncbi:prepilin-type N-terminal cleavage/methylation domain-containing protein [bacterium]|nr:prepilin-type N-terminal cleavage/methylation domain-containing protein [bacterium]